VMAYVEGKPVYMEAANDLLFRSYGTQVAEQLIANELVRQAAEKENITITQEDIQEELDKSLAGLFRSTSQPADRAKLLDTFLQRRNISRKQWDLTMRRNAILRKLVKDQVSVSDEEIHDVYLGQYGKKAQVSMIQVASLPEAQEIIEKANLEGADFAKLAQKYSKHGSARMGGALPPLGQADKTAPPAILQAAMALKEVEDISDPIQVATDFYILKLNNIIEPSDVKLDDVTAEIKARLLEQKIRAEQMQYLRNSFESAEIKLVHPILKEQVE